MSIHREFNAEHVGTSLELISRSVHELQSVQEGEYSGAISSPTRKFVLHLYGGNGIAPVHCIGLIFKLQLINDGVR